MGQFAKPLHPFHPSHNSFVLLPFLGLLLSPPFSWPCVCSVGFGGWRMRPVITWCLTVSKKPIPAVSFKFDMSDRSLDERQEALLKITIEILLWCLCLFCIAGNIYLPMRLIPLHTHKKQTLHITYIPVLALFVSRTTIWRRSWLAQEERLFLLCHFFFFFLLFKVCIYPYVLLQILSLNMLLENYHQHCNVFRLLWSSCPYNDRF